MSKKIKLDTFTATMIAEGQCELTGISEDELTEELYLKAWQYLVDTGLAWSLQGSFGRTATALIEEGLIKPKGVSNE